MRGVICTAVEVSTITARSIQRRSDQSPTVNPIIDSAVLSYHGPSALTSKFLLVLRPLVRWVIQRKLNLPVPCHGV